MSDRPSPLPLDGEALFDIAPVALSVLDLEGRQVRANRAYFDLFGFAPDDLPRLDALTVSHPDERERTNTYLRELAAGRRSRVELQKRYVRKDGSEFTGRLTATALSDDHGATVALLGVIEDVTDRVEQHDQLDGVRRRMESLMANISDTVTVVDADGRVIDGTGFFDEVLGYPSGFWSGRSVWDLTDPEQAEELAARYREVLDNPGHKVQFDIRLRTVAGSWQHIDLTAVNLMHEPTVAGIVLTTRNITERKELELALGLERDHALEEARLLSEFTARVSHELRNQIHALAGLTELVSTSEVPRAVRELAANAKRTADQLQHLVKDLLQFSRNRATVSTATPVPTLPRRVVADMASIGRQLARDPVRVETHVDAEVPEAVMIDDVLIRQVLANLVSNAAKFTEDGVIGITVEDASRDGVAALRWSVRDTGKGIPVEAQDRIFVAFEQVSEADRHIGTGLGLSISSQLVGMMGGRISVESAPGLGSAFAVDTPCTPTDAEVTAPDPKPTELPRSGVRVLVVEDNPVNQLLVAEQLKRVGAVVTVAADGFTAVEAMSAPERFDIVLMDWQMPGLDGVEATRRIRGGEPEGTHTPIIGMTASAQTADRRTCVDAGMDDVLVKPVGLDELAATLAAHTSIDPGPGPGDSTRVDLDALDRLAVELGTTGPVRSIVTTYLEELAKRRDAVATAVSSGDRDLLCRTAHTLRATSRTLGATTVDALAQRLEREDFPPAPDLLADFDAAAEATVAGLERWLAGVPA